MDSTGGSVVGSARGCVSGRSEQGRSWGWSGVWGTNPHREQSGASTADGSGCQSRRPSPLCSVLPCPRVPAASPAALRSCCPAVNPGPRVLPRHRVRCGRGSAGSAPRPFPNCSCSRRSARSPCAGRPAALSLLPTSVCRSFPRLFCLVPLR